MSLYSVKRFFSQGFFISKPTFTEQHLPDQADRVYIITGGYAGVGYHLSRLLYSRGATVWIAGRSESKASTAIDSITSQYPNSSGKLHFLKVDLSDLATIKPAVEYFLSRESKLHWLNNNAGIMVPPADSKGAQGLDLQYQTNIYGPFLLTKLLMPVLIKTAAEETSPGSVRVSFAGSSTTYLNSPVDGLAFTPDGKDLQFAFEPVLAYGMSKSANYFMATEFSRRFGQDGDVLVNSYNPGNLHSELQRHSAAVVGRLTTWLIIHLLTFPPVLGAYTELAAGLSPEFGDLKRDQAAWIVPWGKRDVMRPDIKAQAEKGAEGLGGQLWDLCEAITGKYA